MVGEEPGYHAVDVPLQDPGDVLHALPPAEADLGVLQGDRMAAKPRDAHVKGYPGTYRGLLEYQRDGSTGERPLPPVARLDPAGQVQDCLELAPVEPRDVGEIRTAKFPQGAGRHEGHINRRLRCRREVHSELRTDQLSNMKWSSGQVQRRVEHG